MKTYGYGLFGGISALLALTIGSNFSFVCVAMLYAFSLLRTFQNPSRGTVWSYLIGLTAGMELLSNSHFGLWSLFCLITWLLELLFQQRLRFTSETVRSLFALALLLGIYHIFFTSGNASYTWLPLSFSYIVLTLITLLRRDGNAELAYGLN